MWVGACEPGQSHMRETRASGLAQHELGKEGNTKVQIVKISAVDHAFGNDVGPCWSGGT
jgi:hypothetical protein